MYEWIFTSDMEFTYICVSESDVALMHRLILGLGEFLPVEVSVWIFPEYSIPLPENFPPDSTQPNTSYTTRIKTNYQDDKGWDGGQNKSLETQQQLTYRQNPLTILNGQTENEVSWTDWKPPTPLLRPIASA